MGLKAAILFPLVALLMAGPSRGSLMEVERMQQIRKGILQDYDRLVYPGNQTSLRVGMTPLRIDVDEEKDSITVHGFLQVTWVDPRLEFDRTIPKITFSKEEIWVPDLAMYNSAFQRPMSLYDDENPLVYPNGTVLLVPPTSLESACQLDLTDWPHDSQQCDLIVGSWIYDEISMPIEIGWSFEDTEDFGISTDEGEWQLEEFSLRKELKHYSCCKEPYGSIHMDVKVKRNSPAYYYSVEIPVVVAGLATLVVFLLPPEAGEKMWFIGLSLVLDFMVTFYTACKIGTKISSTPLILTILGHQMILKAISFIVSPIVIRMARSPRCFGLPAILKQILAFIGYCLGIFDYSCTTVGSVDAPSNKGDGAPEWRLEANPEWVLLGAVIDRVALVVYIVLVIVNLA